MLSVRCASWSKSMWSVKRHTLSSYSQLMEAGVTRLADLLLLSLAALHCFLLSQLLSWVESGFYNDTCLHPFHFHLTRDVIQISLAFSDYHRLLFSADDKSPYLQGMSLACALPSGALAVVTRTSTPLWAAASDVSWLGKLKRLSPSRHGISVSETAGCPGTV